MTNDEEGGGLTIADKRGGLNSEEHLIWLNDPVTARRDLQEKNILYKMSGGH